MIGATDRSGDARSVKNGFALIIVIWGIGIIALLVTSFMLTARWRIQSASNVSGADVAEALAEAAINVSLFKLLAEGSLAQRATHDGAPLYCSLPGDAAAVIVVEDERGKVDLNGASPKLLQALFAGFGVDMREAEHLASSVVAFRTSATNKMQIQDAEYAAAGMPFGPKRALFQTALELDQVVGLAPELFRALTPFVTVYSRRPGLDPQVAPPALFAALAGYSNEDVQALTLHPFPNNLDRRDPRFPAAFKQVTGGGGFLVHAEVLMPSGQTGLYEVIAQPSRSVPGQLAIKELRRGHPRYLDELRALRRDGLAAALPSC